MNMILQVPSGVNICSENQGVNQKRGGLEDDLPFRKTDFSGCPLSNPTFPNTLCKAPTFSICPTFPNQFSGNHFWLHHLGPVGISGFWFLPGLCIFHLDGFILSLLDSWDEEFAFGRDRVTEILRKLLDGGNSDIFWCSPLFGEDEPILTSIFFKWIGSTTN